MSVKITSLELENVKRIKAVKLEPSPNGLTIIGGKNNQGKTSVLDAIAWALGGDKYKLAAREGAYTNPILHLELSNGLIVERRGKNSNLKVIDPHGNKSGQQLLNSFISVLALDLPKFMNASDKEKGDILLQIIGVGDQLAKLETEENQLYNQRTAIGRIADQKKKYAEELQCWENVPDVPVSASELIARQQEILAKNGENQRKRRILSQLEDQYEQVKRQYMDIIERKKQLENDLQIARTAAQNLQDESTAELERDIAAIDTLNVKIRDNLNKEHAEEEAKSYSEEYAKLTELITAVRQQKQDLLLSADLPLEGLTVESGKLLYHGKGWDSMSGSDQLRVATAIVRKLNPQCGFVLLDKLEQMDADTLSNFGAWLEQEGLQAIATRVSVGDECSIIIEDGYVAGQETPVELPLPPQPIQKAWTKGAF
jgi:predicted ATP-dependent endonuclease of OLD family